MLCDAGSELRLGTEQEKEGQINTDGMEKAKRKEKKNLYGRFKAGPAGRDEGGGKSTEDVEKVYNDDVRGVIVTCGG